MADHADDDFDGDIFVYRGGRAPQHVTHVLIDKSVDEIEDNAFEDCRHLLTVDTHDGIRKVGKRAFYVCTSLRWINLKSAVDIDEDAFSYCKNLESVEFGDRLETIGRSAFSGCTSLTHLEIPSIITIKQNTFWGCKCLLNVELSERLESIGRQTFRNCERLQRIAVPLQRNLLSICDIFQNYRHFDGCEQLVTVDLVGGLHKTVTSLHMESWRTEMITEINRINQVLPTTPEYGKTRQIRQWMESLLDKLDYYKAEHCRYVKEGITLLELALWKAKLDEKEEYAAEGRTKKAKVDAESYRRDKRITCGADTVIKNVLPFLKLEE